MRDIRIIEKVIPPITKFETLTNLVYYLIKCKSETIFYRDGYFFHCGGIDELVPTNPKELEYVLSVEDIIYFKHKLKPNNHYLTFNESKYTVRISEFPPEEISPAVFYINILEPYTRRAKLALKEIKKQEKKK